ncbi:GNAT family N-acetyltransferase [Streptomyces sp. LN785]|uniref:GNAT family N-acetyltransferase n=1 Tax=Streptomyces sp. LN785 TaxID=3112983 RepID=UPI0037141EE4
MIIEPLRPAADALTGPLLHEITALHSSNLTYQRLSGDFPDPGAIRPEQVAASLAGELADPDTEVLLARARGRLVGMAITLAHHPDPADPDPWIGLLMVDAGQHRSGYGRRLARTVEERFRAAGRDGIRLAVLENNPEALAFWTALGYEVIGRRRDLQQGRPCAVLRKPLESSE